MRPSLLNFVIADRSRRSTTVAVAVAATLSFCSLCSRRAVSSSRTAARRATPRIGIQPRRTATRMRDTNEIFMPRMNHSLAALTNPGWRQRIIAGFCGHRSSMLDTCFLTFSACPRKAAR